MAVCYNQVAYSDYSMENLLVRHLIYWIAYMDKVFLTYTDINDRFRNCLRQVIIMKKREKTKLLLIGGGITQACLLKQFARADLAKFEIIMLSSKPVISYPEMAANFFYGYHSEEDIQLDLAGICREKGIQYVWEDIYEIDSAHQVVKTENGRVFSYDIAVINPDDNYQTIEGLLKYGVPIRLGENLPKVKQDLSGKSAERIVTIVGAGKLGVELALSLRIMFNKLKKYPVISVIEAAHSVLPGFDLQVKELVMDELINNGIELLLGRKVARITGDLLVFSDNQILDYGYLIWTPKPTVNPMLKERGLAVENGLLRLNSYLQSFNMLNLFGAGGMVTVGGNYFDFMADPIEYAELLLKNIRRYSEKNRLIKVTPPKQKQTVLNIKPKHAVQVVKERVSHGKHIWKKKKLRDLKLSRKLRVI